MKTCPNCQGQIHDDAGFCPLCGTSVNPAPQANIPYQSQQSYNQQGYAQPGYNQQPMYTPAPAFDPNDHTAEFDAADIAENKLFAMLVYLADIIGVVVALLAAKDSKFVGFHVKQALRFTIAEVLLALAISLLAWTFIVPIVGAIALVVLVVVKIIAFFQAAKGQAKDAVIIRSIGFLK